VRLGTNLGTSSAMRLGVVVLSLCWLFAVGDGMPARGDVLVNPFIAPGDAILLWDAGVAPLQINSVTSDGAYTQVLGPRSAQPEVAHWLSLSPDGTNLGYWDGSSRSIIVRNITGNHFVAIPAPWETSSTGCCSSLSWSPDGSRFVVSGGYLVDISGVVTQLPHPAQVDNLTWTPDGQWIYYVAVGYPPTNYQDLWRMHPDGSGNSFVAPFSFNVSGGSAPITISPDGSKIAGLCPGPAPLASICILDLATNQESSFPYGPIDLSMAWGPDSDHLAIANYPSSLVSVFTLSTGNRVYLQNSSGGAVTAASVTWGAPNVSSDTFPPIVTGTPDRPPDQNGWYNQPVTINWSAIDPSPTSGDPTQPATTTVATEGSSQVITSSQSCDPAGNCATGSYTVSVDLSDPIVTCPSTLSFPLNQAGATVTASVSDAVSGPASATVSSSVSTSSVGLHTVSLTGFNVAGRSTTVFCSYRVMYVVQAFQAPIDSPPTFNVAKAGKKIAVKWRLTDANGVPIDDPASFVSVTSGSTTCSPTDPTDDIESYSGNSGLQSLGNGYWQWNWATQAAYAGQCRVLRLNLADAAAGPTALFQFK
jgi:WD40-like Beta Propeller Repeat